MLMRACIGACIGYMWCLLSQGAWPLLVSVPSPLLTDLNRERCGRDGLGVLA
jgi:hypothetical protein